MTIVLCGGGSGGHITPLLAVARELRARDSSHRIIYLGERRGKFSHIAENSGLFDECRYISAGKLRRYHNESWLQRVFDFKTLFFNIRDVFKLAFGAVESIFLFRKLQPDSVLLKGGYVCVPASIGASFTDSLIVTHDSDALPGLSNRFAARYATYHATAMPAKYYDYPKKSIRVVGLPVDEAYRPYPKTAIAKLKTKYGLPAESKIVLVTGGSNGARRLNDWALAMAYDLLPKHKELIVYLLAGKGNEDQVSKYPALQKFSDRLKILDFTSELFNLCAVSDVIITRAGATTITEFASAQKAIILVPNPGLTGGHQLKNAKVYEDNGSAIVLHESELKGAKSKLSSTVEHLLKDESVREQLGKKLHSTLPKDSPAKLISNLLLGDKE